MNSWASAAVRDVGADRVREQEAVLHHQADRGAQRVQGQVADVLAADPDGAAPDVVEAGQQQGDRRLARARGADHGERLTRRHVQRQAPQHRLGRQVTERHVVELDVRRPRRQDDRAGLLGDHRPGVDHLVDPDHAGPRLLSDRDQAGQRPHRRDHLPDVEGEGEEDPDLDLAVQGQPAAQREDPDLAEHGNGPQGGVVPGRQPDDAEPGGVQPRAYPLQPLDLLLLLAEALDHPHACHRAVDDARDLRLLLLRVPAGGEEPAARGDRDQPERRRDRQGDQGEHWRQVGHDADRQHEQQGVAEEHRHLTEQALDHVEIGNGAADDLPGVQLVLAGPVQPLQRTEQLVPHVVLDLKRQLPAPVPPGIDAGEAEQPGHDEHRGPQPDRLAVVKDRAVHNPRHDQRDARLNEGGQQ